MATVVAAVAALASTSNAAGYTSGSFIPAADELLVVIPAVTTQTATDWAVTDGQGGTWTKVRRQVKNSSADIMEVWVRNEAAPAASMTVTFSHASGNASGCTMSVLRVAGMSKYGADAVRSQGGQDNQAAATPAPALNQAALTGNPVIVAVHNATNPATMTPPTNWTEIHDVGYNTPATGLETAARDSGFTGTTITYGSASASAFSSLAIELDPSALLTGSATDPLDLLDAASYSHTPGGVPPIEVTVVRRVAGVLTD